MAAAMFLRPTSGFDLIGNVTLSSPAADEDIDRGTARPVRHAQNHQHVRGSRRVVRSGDSAAGVGRFNMGQSLGPLMGTGAGSSLSASYEASIRRLPTDTMMAKLGDDFDPRRMSIERPLANQTRPEVDSSSAAAHIDDVNVDDPELMADLRRLRFTYRDDRGDEHQLRPSVIRQLERWLLDRARCAVRYTWDDLGPLFWPRWIRHGACDTRAACSWPPGMHCAPAESDTLRLLHWQCRRTSGAETGNSRSARAAAAVFRSKTYRRRRLRSSDRTQCRWKKVPYPVTSQCFCSC
jgi:noggin